LIKGTGKDQRITKNDILNFINQPSHEDDQPSIKDDNEVRFIIFYHHSSLFVLV